MRKSGRERTYREAFLRFGATVEVANGYPRPGCPVDSLGIPHPRYFAKRGWICLIAKELTFLRVQKSPQEYESKGTAAKTDNSAPFEALLEDRGKQGKTPGALS